MSVKKIEKLYAEVVQMHESNRKFWSESEKDILKNVNSLMNHNEQTEKFSKLTVSHLQLISQFPDIRQQLLYKLSSLSQQFETKLTEYAEIFEEQCIKLQELVNKIIQCSSSQPITVTSEIVPGDVTIAEKIHFCYKLSRLYQTIDLKLSSWLGKKDSQMDCWRIKDELSKVALF